MRLACQDTGVARVPAANGRSGACPLQPAHVDLWKQKFRRFYGVPFEYVREHVACFTGVQMQAVFIRTDVPYDAVCE